MNARPLMRLRFTTAPVEEIGLTPHGTLSIFPITGGSFEGERLRGTVRGGADWVTAAADGTRGPEGQSARDGRACGDLNRT